MYVVFYAYFKCQFSNLTLAFYPPYFMIFFAPSRNSIQIKGQKLLVPKTGFIFIHNRDICGMVCEDAVLLLMSPQSYYKHVG